MTNVTVTTMRTSFATVALVFGVASCGGGGDDSLTAREAWEQSVDQGCSKAHECRDSAPAELPFELVFGANVEECKTLVADFAGTGAQVQASVDAGRVTYDEADAEACLAYDPSCTAFWSDDDPNEPAGCETGLRGAVATGGSCTIALDCTSEDDSCEGGTCTAFLVAPTATAPRFWGMMKSL
jgi:hypothetical protein